METLPNELQAPPTEGVLSTVLIEFTEKGEAKLMGKKDFHLLPRIGEKVTVPSPEGEEKQVYEVIDVHHLSTDSKIAAQVYVKHVGDLKEYHFGLRWRMKAEN